MAVSDRAVFLDKDGTLVENVPYNVDPAHVTLARGAVDALRALHSAGYRLFVVSNQSGVARGIFSERQIAGVEATLREIVERIAVPLDAFYYCPHHPEGVTPQYAIVCDCRKPAPGMLRRAADEHNIALAGSWMIGDILDDIEAGRRAGCRTVLVDNGGETEWRTSGMRQPHYIARELLDAAQHIVSHDQGAEAHAWRHTA